MRADDGDTPILCRVLTPKGVTTAEVSVSVIYKDIMPSSEEAPLTETKKERRRNQHAIASALFKAWMEDEIRSEVDKYVEGDEVIIAQTTIRRSPEGEQ